MSNPQTDPLVQVETTCGSLLYELQIIWDEVGESEADRDKLLLEIEQECLEVYRRKVDLANRSRAQLRQAIADSEAELAAICSAMGERPVHVRQSDKNTESLKEELRRTLPQLEEMRKRKSDRRNQFLEVQEQIRDISNEIYGTAEYISSKKVVDESDLSLRKLEELHRELHELQKEKSDRLRQVQEHVSTVNSLCSVLGVDSKNILTEVYPSLGDSVGSKNISNNTINQLAAATQKLREVKLQRMQRLQDLASTMLELWNLMDTPIEEQQMFQTVTLKVDEAPESYRIDPKTEIPTQLGGGPTMAATATATATAVSPGTGMKKKRGRPRKYGADGTVTLALSPMPISSSIPLTGEFSAWKRGRGRPTESIKKSHKYEYESSGERIAYSVGANFTPHVITVNAGEDVTMKVMSFSQQGSRAICILSANGTISNVTLRQPASSGGTLTYEGRFEILSLSGSFMPTEKGGTKSRSGGMSVSLAGPDGRVMGGGLAGLLVAAGPVQVVVGSFLPGHQQEQKPKKQRIEPTSTAILTPPNPLRVQETKGVYGGEKAILTSFTPLHGDSSAFLNPIQGSRSLAADIKTSMPEEESKGASQMKCEVSC